MDIFCSDAPDWAKTPAMHVTVIDTTTGSTVRTFDTPPGLRLEAWVYHLHPDSKIEILFGEPINAQGRPSFIVDMLPPVGTNPLRYVGMYVA